MLFTGCPAPQMGHRLLRLCFRHELPRRILTSARVFVMPPYYHLYPAFCKLHPFLSLRGRNWCHATDVDPVDVFIFIDSFVHPHLSISMPHIPYPLSPRS